MAAPKKSILFVTNAEYGQANVILAAAYEVLSRNEYSVHVASFASLGRRVDEFNQIIPKLSPARDSDDGIHFHPLPAKSMADSQGGIDFREPPGSWSGIKTISKLFCTWSPEDYVAIANAIIAIVDRLDPALIVCDNLFFPGIDILNKVRTNSVFLSPLSYKETAAREQGLRNFYDVPLPSSGFSYPMPWFTRLKNIWLLSSLLYVSLTDPKIKELTKYRNDHGFEGKHPDSNEMDKKLICCGFPEFEYPMTFTDRVTGCGPITLPVLPVSKADPQFLQWLQQGPTVMIVLGSHIDLSASLVREIATALRTLLDQRSDIQVLWKLKYNKTIQSGPKTSKTSVEEDSKEAALSIVQKEIDEDRVRVVSWLEADPAAILESGCIVCSVHHGGANSTFEAVANGVPQIVLPVWWDTYDFACRVEWLGLGVWGSRKAAPFVEASEFAEALATVVGVDEKGEAAREARRKKCVEFKEISKTYGGRVKAVDLILEAARQ